MDKEIKSTDTASKEPWQDHQEPGEFGELNGLVAKSGAPKETGFAPSREGVVEALKTRKKHFEEIVP